MSKIQTESSDTVSVNDKNLPHTSDTEVFAGFLGGCVRSFEILVERYDEELFHFLNGIVHDYHEAKQLTIESFAQLAAKGKQFEGKSTLKTYLFTIGKNLAFKYIKMRRQFEHISYEDTVATLISENGDPGIAMLKEESKAILHTAIKQLKDDYRAVIWFLYFEEMSYKQAGNIMKKTEKQIKNMAYKAKAMLRENLAKLNYYD